MRSAYGISRTVLRQINDVLEGEGDIPAWINLRRIQEGDDDLIRLNRVNTYQNAQYEPTPNSALVNSVIRRDSYVRRDILS